MTLCNYVITQFFFPSLCKTLHLDKGTHRNSLFVSAVMQSYGSCSSPTYVGDIMGAVDNRQQKQQTKPAQLCVSTLT